MRCGVLNHLRTLFVASAAVTPLFTASVAFSLASQAYASPGSKPGHVNCKTRHQLEATLSRHFENVFISSMDDDVVDAACQPMEHYSLVLCTTPVR
jgi:hypothetical protein